jgi:hypothetical protein
MRSTNEDGPQDRPNSTPDYSTQASSLERPNPPGIITEAEIQSVPLRQCNKELIQKHIRRLWKVIRLERPLEYARKLAARDQLARMTVVVRDYRVLRAPKLNDDTTSQDEINTRDFAAEAALWSDPVFPSVEQRRSTIQDGSAAETGDEDPNEIESMITDVVDACFHTPGSNKNPGYKGPGHSDPLAMGREQEIAQLAQKIEIEDTYAEFEGRWSAEAPVENKAGLIMGDPDLMSILTRAKSDAGTADEECAIIDDHDDDCDLVVARQRWRHDVPSGRFREHTREETDGCPSRPHQASPRTPGATEPFLNFDPDWRESVEDFNSAGTFTAFDPHPVRPGRDLIGLP